MKLEQTTSLQCESRLFSAPYWQTYIYRLNVGLDWPEFEHYEARPKLWQTVWLPLGGGFPFVIVLSWQNFIHSIFEPPVLSTKTVGGIAMQDYKSQAQCMIDIYLWLKC